ncbi:MAG: hypothetical protein N2053_03430, partial [Chitinispirillaceae bacterium]|nr:hypothetical protein [Chitinispirillaceae bacterium]
MNIDVLKLLTESKNKLPIGEGRRFSREDRENSISKEKLQKESNFREILAEVRENNIRSTNITDDSVKIRERNNVKDTKEESDIAEKYYNKSEINPEYIPQDLIASSETEEILEIDPALSEKAGKILEEALKKICDALNLTTLPIDEINFVRITESIEEQFAEILFLVGKIIEDIENGAILPEDKKIFGNTDALLDTLLTNKFKIELAFNMLGVSENIQKKVDNRNGVNGFDGIIKATEPSQIKMPTLHSEKIFNSFSGIEREKTIEAIIEKIKQLISEDSGEFTLTISEKVQKGEELAAFDSKTYRCILKIDKPVDSSVKSEKNLEEVIAIPTDNKNQLSSEGNGSKFEEALLNREDLVFTNGKVEITTQQSLDRGYNSLSSNILKEEEIVEQINAKFRGM